jgi:hypothetical protein
MQLTQQETNKVKERDEQHTVELREWRVEIAKRKQVHIEYSSVIEKRCLSTTMLIET